MSSNGISFKPKTGNMTTDESSWAPLGRLLGQAARWWRRSIDLALRPYGLTEATWVPLIYVARSPKPLLQKELADSLGLDRSAVVRLLDALEEAKLVERRMTEGDRRSWTIVATRAGHDVAARVETAAAEVRRRATQDIPVADLQTTMRVLDRICRTLAEGS
jgi:MarR family transcriptional regulator, transcriptional regulator for hemolysin